MTKRVEYGKGWKAVRKWVLKRDNHICQIRGKGCTFIANEVDHILPYSLGGPSDDPDNLRAACQHCNRSRGNTISRKLQRRAEPEKKMPPKQAPPSRDW